MDSDEVNIDIIETIKWSGPSDRQRVKIELFQLRGKWGFCLDVWFLKGGFCYGPVPKFCDFYATRDEAICAGVHEIIERVGGCDSELCKWAAGLLQLSLF